MMGISLFGTCTMKYNPRAGQAAVARPQVAELHPQQDEKTLQGLLELIHGLDLLLRELSGMDRFVFQPGGGADAAYTHACVTRAYLAARGRARAARRGDHHASRPTRATRRRPPRPGFNVVTLPLEEDGYPSVEALRAAVSDRTRP